MSLDILRDNQADTDEVRLVQKNPDNTDRQRTSALSIDVARFLGKGLMFENWACQYHLIQTLINVCLLILSFEADL